MSRGLLMLAVLGLFAALASATVLVLSSPSPFQTGCQIGIGSLLVLLIQELQRAGER